MQSYSAQSQGRMQIEATDNTDATDQSDPCFPCNPWL